MNKLARGHLEGIQCYEEIVGMEEEAKKSYALNFRHVINKWVFKIKVIIVLLVGLLTCSFRQ